MTIINLRIPSVPIAQPRQRHRIMTGKGGRQFVQNYTKRDAPVNAFKASAQQSLSRAYKGQPLQGPLVMTVTFLFPRPKRLIWKSRPMPRLRHESAPDCDNVVKSLKDALSKLAYADDSQVSETHQRKLYAAGDEQPGVLVKIATVDAEDTAWVFPRTLPKVCPGCLAKAIEIGIAVTGERCEACSGLFGETNGVTP